MFEFFQTILSPIMLGEAWVMYAWHWLFDKIGLPTGWAWAMSIVGLTVIVRMLLIPLFVKQIHSSRRMQLIQPEMQKIQKKYKGKRDPESQKAQQAEMMDLYRRTGTNPFSSCLPILVQSPFFFALFQLLNNLKAIAVGNHAPIGPFTRELAGTIESSTIFGARLSDSFLGTADLSTKILTAVLIVLMSATTFITQHQLMRRNMPAASLDNPFAKQQKVILYLMPIFFAVSGINFPIGVLVYWLTTNVWTMGQQFYVIRNMPAPGSAAEEARRARLKRRGKDMEELTVPGLNAANAAAAEGGAPVEPQPRQRQQPTSKKRAKKGKSGNRPAQGGNRPAGGAKSGGQAGSKPGTSGTKTGKPAAQGGKSSGKSGKNKGPNPSTNSGS